MVNTITYGLPAQQLTGRYAEAAKEEPAKTPVSGDRTVRDTIEISEDGQKIINLARGAELAAELPDAAKDRAAFDAALERAQEDIKRITTLFGGVLNPLANLQSAAEAGEQTEVATADAEFAATLRRALDDVRQITADFNESINNARSNT